MGKNGAFQGKNGKKNSTRQLAQDTEETPQNQKPHDQVYSQAATGADQPIQQRANHPTRNTRGKIVIKQQ